MRYMLLIYTREDEAAKTSPQEQEKASAGHYAVLEDAIKKGVLHGAGPLKPTRIATTVRKRNGKTLTSDGPFAETKEQLAGYYILDCKDRDEAIAWAARIPTVCGGAEGCVEIRELQEMSVAFAALADARNG